MLADRGFPGAYCCSLCGLLVFADQPAGDPRRWTFASARSLASSALQRWP